MIKPDLSDNRDRTSSCTGPSSCSVRDCFREAIHIVRGIDPATRKRWQKRICEECLIDIFGPGEVMEPNAESEV